MLLRNSARKILVLNAKVVKILGKITTRKDEKERNITAY
jgi:hypothetical protein